MTFVRYQRLLVFSETLYERIMHPVQMLGMNRISRTFTDFGLAFDHDRNAFSALRCVDHAFAFLQGGHDWNLLTLGNSENLFLLKIAEIYTVAKSEHVCLRC